MGLCGSRAEASVDGAPSATSVLPSKDSGLTEARLREIYNESDYMAANGYSAVAMFCGDEAARKFGGEYHSSDEGSDEDSDQLSGDTTSELSRQSSRDSLLSSRPSSADSYSSMSSMGSAFDDTTSIRATAPGVAAMGKTQHSSTKSFVSDRQNSFEDRENEIANAIQEIKRKQDEKLRKKRERRQSLRERELAMKQREEARRNGGRKLPPIKKSSVNNSPTVGGGHKNRKRQKETAKELKSQEQAQSIIAEYEMQSHVLHRSRSIAQDNQRRSAQARRNRSFFRMDNKP